MIVLSVEQVVRNPTILVRRGGRAPVTTWRRIG